MQHAESNAVNDIFSFALPASVSTDNVEEVASRLKQSLPPQASVAAIDASATETAGTPLIQFLLAAAKTCESSGLIFLITNPQPVLRKAFEDAGLAAWLMQREAT